jgi:DNA repair protein RecN (Recombination protein N)
VARAVAFDEIDAGVSGAVAHAVGARLGRMARGRQVLCVTRLPQIAAHAEHHFRVTKRVVAGRTHTSVEPLDEAERVEELARMLGGEQATAASRRHAAELLAAARSDPRPTRRRA